MKLNEKAIYMNIFTGSVASGAERMQDYVDRAHLSKDFEEMSWEEWNDGALCEVEMINGDWVEVE